MTWPPSPVIQAMCFEVHALAPTLTSVITTTTILSEHILITLTDGFDKYRNYLFCYIFGDILKPPTYWYPYLSGPFWSTVTKWKLCWAIQKSPKETGGEQGEEFFTNTTVGLFVYHFSPKSNHNREWCWLKRKLETWITEVIRLRGEVSCR